MDASILLKFPPDGKDREQIFSIACDVQMKAGKRSPRQRGYIEGIGWPARLGNVMRVRSVPRKIVLISFQEGRIVLGKLRPKAGKGVGFLVKDRIGRRHVIIYPQPLLRYRCPEFGKFMHRIR